MTKSILRICAISALALAASPMLLSAEDKPGLEGVWDVSVTVTNCQTGALIRTVRSIQMFDHHGAFTETANTFLRGSSLGSWAHAHDQNFDATYWFFRYKPDGTFASFAKSLDSIELGQDGSTFTASGTIQDFDATGASISIGCFTHAATRLTAPPKED